MDTDCGMPIFRADCEWSYARIDARVPHFRDGPFKARRSGLHIDVHPRQTCVECEEQLKPRQAGFFLAAGCYYAADPLFSESRTRDALRDPALPTKSCI